MRGFTLTEVIITTSIIGLIALFTLANYRQGSDSLDQARSIQSVAQAVRTAQNRSLASDCPDLPCRFGVHFVLNDTKVIVFDDINADNLYADGEEVETVSLEEDIVLSNVSPAYACGQLLCLDILFVPPDPVATTSAALSFPAVVSITGNRSIIINERGSVDVQ